MLAAQTITGTTNTNLIDLAGVESCTFVVNAGAGTSTGIYTITVQESATTTGTAFADTAAGNYIDTPVTLSAASGHNTFTQQIGYVRSDNTKRYVRLAITKDGNGNSQLVGVDVILGNTRATPAADATPAAAV